MSRGYWSVVFPGLFAIASLSAASCSRNEDSATATTTVVAALNASPKTSDFVIEAQNSVRLQTGGMVVNGGDIGARGTSGPFLADSAAVDALTGVQVQATHNIIAASVNLGTGAQVGDVQTSHLVTGTGATHGSVSALVPLPALPAAVAVSPGTTNLTVATGATVTAAAGHFATISVGTGSTLKLGAGAYDMTTLTLSTGAKLQALGAVQIHVAGKLTTSSGAIIGPASGVTLTASGIRIEVSGQNGSTGALTATPPAASFGTGNNVTALILVPNGTLAFGTGAIAKGAFMGRDVDLGGAGATITYQDGFSNGTCTAQSCDDGNPCTIDTCGTNGACTHASASAGTSCSDGNACNGSETCDGAGTCKAGTPVVCAADQCHTVGACVPATGCPAPVAKTNGTTCNDANACTTGETCQAGVCTGGTAVTCTGADQCHTVGACVPATGCPAAVAVANGTTCNDGNACTQTDTCQAGTCTGGNPKSCVASDECHVAGTCVPATGVCSNPTAANGTTCNDGNACTQTDTCQAGSCTGGNPKSCVASDQCHVAGTCVPATGVCSNPTAANGTTCNDGNACTQTDTCQAGTCTGGNPKSCVASDQCHVAGTCNPTSGACSNPTIADGTTCNDGNACTSSDSCHAGACSGTTVTCTAQDQCHTAGICNPTSGACSNPTIADGTTCNDGNSCTTNDACHGGSCSGTGSCASVTIAQVTAFVQTTPQLSTTLSTTLTTPAVPGDVVPFSSTVTNAGFFYVQGGSLQVTNSGSSPFTIGAFEQTIEYFSTATQTWVPVGKVTFDATGTEVDDPTLTVLQVGAIFGTVVPPGPLVQLNYPIQTSFPAATSKILFDSTQASQVRSVLHLDAVGTGFPDTTLVQDLTATFQENSGTVSGTTVFISFIGGGLETDANLSAPNTTLNPGDSATFTGTCPAPALPPRDPNDTDAAYLHNLGFNLGFGDYAARAFANAHGVPVDPAQSAGVVQIPWQFPILNVTKSGPVQGNAGLTLPFSIQLQNVGTATAGPFTVIDTIGGTDIGAQISIPTSVAAGATGTATASVATPLAQTPGSITDVAVVTWQDRNGNVYGPISSTSFTTNIVAGHPEGYLTLVGPPAGAPEILGSAATFTATALDGLGHPVPNLSVSFTISGVNGQTVSVLTGADGTASFSYDGPNLGRDTVTVTATINGPALHASVPTLTWAATAAGTTPCTGRDTPLDVMLVIDASPSMFSDDQITAAEAATNSFIGDLDLSIDQVGSVIFSGDAPLAAQLTSDAGTLTSETNAAFSSAVHACDGFCAGGSNFQAALQTALTELQSPRHRAGAQTLIVFLSDGGNTGADPTAEIAAVKAAGVRIVALAFGSAVNVAEMRQIASSTNDYFYAPSVAELGWIYGNIDQNACRTTPPLVSAGGNQGMYEARLPDSLTLQGEAHGTGPRGDLNLVSTWTEVSGPASVAFADASSPVTDVLFTEPGTYVLQLEATDGFLTTADRATITVDPAPSLTGANLAVSLSAAGPLTVGTAETLSAVLTDAQAHPIGNFLVQVTVTGANPTSGTASTNAAGVATFTYIGTGAGTDVIQAVAIGGTAQLAAAPLSVSWTHAAPGGGNTGVVSQGWIGAPGQRARVMGLVPITVAAGVTVASATVSYWPANAPTNIQTLATTAAGGPGATLATLDTTTIPNGAYVIDVNGIDSQGNVQDNEILVAVGGDYKPGREVVDITEFTVPLPGIPITVGRRYDSLEKDEVGDFGNGWSLKVGHPDLQVDLANDVTITMPNGRRATFFFGLQGVAAGPIVLGFLAQPVYIAEPGVFGTLTSDGCNLLSFDPTSDNPLPICFGSLFDPVAVNYAPTTYTYTDPFGVVYTMGADGTLRSIRDRNENILTFTPAGITSSAGNKTVTFTRDGQGRITQILAVNLGDFANTRFEYDYLYDGSGNLVQVTAPTVNVFNEEFHYTYDGAHRLLTASDPAGNPPQTMTYDGSGRVATDTDPMGNVTKYAYDVSGHTTTTTFPDTGVMTQTLDDRGLLLSQTDQLGRITKHQYDANQNEVKRTNALGEVTTFTYDANGNQTSTVNALGETTTTTYNAFSEPLAGADPIGNTTTIVYDDQGLPISISDSMGPLATFTSSEHGLPISITDALGNATYLNYDASGDLTARIDRLNRTTTYQYDGMGQKTVMTVAGGNSTQYLYDQSGDLLLIITPLGFGPGRHLDANRNTAQTGIAGAHNQDLTYDADNHLKLTENDSDGSLIHQTADFRGNVLTMIDEVGNMTSYAYDLAGQLVQTTFADGTFMTQSYDSLGRLASKTDERGNTTTYNYEPGCDCTDRIIAVTDPLGRTTNTTYDAIGRKTSTTDATGHQTFFVYDLRGHLIETDYADSTSTHDTYDALGRHTASTDQTGAITHYGYDAEGQLVSVTDPLGNVTGYGYDSNGNLSSVTDANNHTTIYAYDANNRKVGRTLPLGMSETFGYDIENNNTTHTDFRGKTTTYNYDNRPTGRLIAKVPDPSLDEPTVTYAYNLNSTRSRMTDASGATTYGYDGRNRLLTKVTPEGTLTYTYDASGNVASINSSNANGTSVSYAWDAGNQLSTVTDNRLGGTAMAAYTATGRPASLAQPNGMGVTYAYDPLDRVMSMAWKKGTAAAVARWAYTYSARGQWLTSTELTGREAAYGYDTTSRLTSETVTGDPRGASGNGALTYVVDPVGNRQSRTSTLAALGAQTFSYDANDELTTDTYDLNGNATSASAQTYAYDFDNHIVSKDGTAVTLVYDGDGNRVAKMVGGVTTQYLVDELNPTRYLQVMDEVSGGAVLVRYTYGNVPLSQARNMNGTFVPSFYGYDAHRSIAFLSDTTGAVTDTYTYDGWGNLVASTGSTVNTRLYTGQEFDSDIGLINLRARQYEPSTGRFLTLDPLPGEALKPTSLNRYLYADGDPIRLWDPKGKQDDEEEAATTQPAASIAANTATRVTITYGQDAGAHAFRHVIEIGLDRAEVEAAVEQVARDQLASGVVDNFSGIVKFNGYDLGFSGFFRAATLLNIGKIIVIP